MNNEETDCVEQLRSLHACGEELEQRLRLKTFPVAVKLLKRAEEITRKAVRPKRDLGCHLALCQGLAMSRREGATVAMHLDDMWCYSPVLGLGIAKPPDYYLEGNIYYPVHIGSLERAANHARNFPRLEYGEFAGVMSAPLKDVDFRPDLVMVYCDSAQLMCLLAGLKYKQGEMVTSTMDTASACVQAIVPTLKSGRCQVVVPCFGDRKYGLARDDEMIFTVPEGKLADLTAGLRTYIEKAGSGFPMKLGGEIEYPMSESYQRVSEMIGMDVRK